VFEVRVECESMFEVEGTGLQDYRRCFGLKLGLKRDRPNESPLSV
jgi:hypothetical protein